MRRRAFLPTLAVALLESRNLQSVFIPPPVDQPAYDPEEYAPPATTCNPYVNPAVTAYGVNLNGNPATGGATTTPYNAATTMIDD